LSITITTLSATINYSVNNTVYISIILSPESFDTDLYQGQFKTSLSYSQWHRLLCKPLLW